MQTPDAQRDAITRLLRRTRSDRGLATVITDPAVIAKIAATLAAEEVPTHGAT